jgi:hypothetical protein
VDKSNRSVAISGPHLAQHPDLRFVVLLLLGPLSSAQAADLRVMKTGLGKGWIEGPSISCGIAATDAATDTDTIATSCNATSTTPLTLTARTHAGSTFAGWGGDCPTATGTGNTCTVPMDAMRSVRAKFTLNAGVPPLTDLTPSGIGAFLTGAGSSVNTQAEFVAALPQEFRDNWILMTRSESLQTGTPESPRILLINQNATAAFTLGLDEHSSYPGAHPNAIEYMQWDGAPDQKNFRFHEIIVKPVPGLDEIGLGTGTFRFPARARGISEDDQKCFACHSTSNVRNRGTLPGTTGIPIGSVKFKSKPNWDTYDSWGGMLGFNRDRIYKGSVEAAAFRRLMNLWTWQTNEAVRTVIEELALQPAGTRPQDAITRWDTATTDGGANDGRIHFAFDPAFPAVTNEPLPAPEVPSIDVDATYAFNRLVPTAALSPVVRNDDFVVLQHPDTGAGATRFDPDEGRATNFFNNLYLGLNPQRIVDEMSPRAPATSIFATGGVPIDVRPIALAIAQDCITVSGGGSGSDIASTQTISGVTVPAVLAFLNARNGLSFNDVYDDTRRRAQSMTRRKADIQKWNLDRAGDPYVFSGAGADPVVGLIDRDEAATDGIVPPTPAASKRLRQLRQEVFRRPIGPGHPDETALGRIYVDREDDSTDGTRDTTGKMSLFRYFLEPLGVPVDKWSMGVRGRSRTYSFADNFWVPNSYEDTLKRELRASLGVSTCPDIMSRVTAEFARLPGAAATPTYTDIQRIFNKSCIECHGGLYYPPVRNYGITLNFTEDENPPAGERRLWKSLREARSLIGGPTCAPSAPTCTDVDATNVANSYLYSRITDFGDFAHPYDPGNLSGSNEDCPFGVMPCGGPPLGKTDIETIRRWIVGGSPHTEGDPHLRTVDGVNYDFQSAGEFVALRDDGMELQVRQAAVTTAGPLGPDAHTGLSSCVSINTAVAMRVGDHRVTYQPALDLQRGKESQTPRLQLRIDGEPFVLGANPIPLLRGGRIVPTNATGGLEIQIPGGTRVAVTPSFWEPHGVHFMQINVYHGRAVDGIMGAIAPNNWLPRMSNGDFLGPRPASLAQRHHDLYETFADSWRVDATNSLFYYEPGLSPNSFVVPGWPVAQAIGCLAPPQPGVPVPTQPITGTIGQAQAEKLCANVVDPERRGNCTKDVMATGAAVFAEAYLQSQRLDQRVQIAPPKLVSPARNVRIPGTQVVFEWTPVPGTEDVDVTHHHCLWKSGDRFDFNKCTVISVDSGSLGGIIPPAVEKHLSPLVCLILFLLLLLLALILFMANKRKAAAFVLILALLLAVACWLHHRGAREPTSVRIQNLEPGEIYRWKVVTDTRDGLVTESETRRFEVEK